MGGAKTRDAPHDQGCIRMLNLVPEKPFDVICPDRHLIVVEQYMDDVLHVEDAH